MHGALRHLSRGASSLKQPVPPPSLLPRPVSSSSAPPPPPPSSSEDEGHAFSDGLSEIRDRILLLTEKPSNSAIRHEIPDHLRPTISSLASQLLSSSSSSPDLSLDSSPAPSLLSSSPDGAAFVELLSHLRSRPLLALQVFSWRSKQAAHPMQPEEYVKAIALAGRARTCDLALDLFRTATAHGLRTVSTYNALMAAYMYNGDMEKALAVFDDLKRDEACRPTIVTYNILLSLFGRSNLVDHMEEIRRVIRKSDLHLNISSYNTLIAGYLTVAKWEKMEGVFREMEEGPVKPDMDTYSLMLRGFAIAGYLDKMEKMYELAKEHVHEHQVCLLRAMICAYCKSSDPERVRRIEGLLGYIPEGEYRAWLNVLLIRLYAEEGLVEKMESLIHEAFDHETVVLTVGIMKSIITGYFRCDAVDRLAEFVRRAELAGWRMSRSVYHCKMVMYGRHRRFIDMLGVLDEMETFKLEPCKKTFWIMYKAYLNFGERLYAASLLGLMYKNGFEFPADALP